MDPVRIDPEMRSVEHEHPSNPHLSWVELVQTKRFLVSGGWFQETKHSTRKGAEREAMLRRGINAKFPWAPPRGGRELAKARRLGLLPVEGDSDV